MTGSCIRQNLSEENSPTLIIWGNDRLVLERSVGARILRSHLRTHSALSFCARIYTLILRTHLHSHSAHASACRGDILVAVRTWRQECRHSTLKRAPQRLGKGQLPLPEKLQTARHGLNFPL